MPNLHSTLWEASQNQIQPLPHKGAFLALDLCEAPHLTGFDGSLWKKPIQNWLRIQGKESFFLFLNRHREESWQEPPVGQNYQELIHFSRNQAACLGCVWKKNLLAPAKIKKILQTHANPLESLASQQSVAVLSSQHPLFLKTVCIPKPWGFEAWYTGVEKRGVALVETATGTTELPYALALFRQAYLKHHPEDLILLKTLNPVAEEVLGDLYLEMHEKKWEVYVVTEIDPQAWPSGEGIIKAGLHPEKIQQYQMQHGERWAECYLNDFAAHVSAYERLRRSIDQQMDAMRQAHALALDAPLSPEQTQKFLAHLPPQQHDEEKKLRRQVYDFVGDLKVKAGDIIAFPSHQMHSLQHGIRVIEFQTPHYERLIVMFGQKVLTQSHWDTAKALRLMEPGVYQAPPLKVLEKTKTRRVERFVEFPDFSADRITVGTQSDHSDKTGAAYHLLIGVLGEGMLCTSVGESSLLQPKHGWFLPASLGEYTIRNASNAPFVYLKATPNVL